MCVRLQGNLWLLLMQYFYNLDDLLYNAVKALKAAVDNVDRLIGTLCYRMEDCRVVISCWQSMGRAWLVLRKKRKFCYQLVEVWLLLQRHYN